MEGWVGTDRTYIDTPYFRRLTAADFTGPDVCVGAAAGLVGSGSIWAGVLKEEAMEMGYASSNPGYGNQWSVGMERTFSYSGSGNVTLAFDHVTELEYEFDYAYVRVDAGNTGVWTDLAGFTIPGVYSESFVLTLGAEIRSTLHVWIPGSPAMIMKASGWGWTGIRRD